MFRIRIIIVLLCCACLGHAQAPFWHWSEQAGPGNIQEGLSSAFDPVSNSAYFSGYFSGTTIFAGDTLISNGNDDVFLVRYTPEGHVVWAQKAGSSGVDRGHDIATDAQGNVYLTGYFNNTITFYGTPNITLTSAGNEDIFVAMIDSNGLAQWAVRFGGVSLDMGHGIAYHAGSVYIAGEFEGSVNFQPGPPMVANNTDAVLLRLNATNGSIGGAGWASQGGSTNDDAALDIHADASGVYAVGRYGDDITFDNFGGPPTLSVVGNDDAFVVSYSLGGAGQWASKIAGGGNDVGYGIRTDGAAVYVAGSYEGTPAIAWSSGSIPLPTSNGNEDIFLTRLNPSNGQPLWGIREGGGSPDEAMDVAIDGSGNPIICGYFKNAVTFGSSVGLVGSNEAIFVARYSPTGTFDWVKSADGGSSENSYGVATNGVEVYVAGSFRSTASFDAISITSSGWTDIFSAKISCDAIAGQVLADDKFICPGGSTLLSLSGHVGSAIQWQVSPVGMNAWTNVPGGTMPTLVVSPIVDQDYRVYVNNAPCGSDTSLSASVFVLPANSSGCPDSVYLAQGSLIIPMDNTLQPGTATAFNLKAYGLVNELLRNHIPVRWLISQTKPHDGIDHVALAEQVLPAPFTPNAPGPVSSYSLKAGPFAIDSAYVSRAIPLITAFGNGVRVLRTVQGDSAIQKYELTFTPYVGVLNNGGNQALHLAVLAAASVNPASYTVINAGSVTTGNTCYTFTSEAHWNGNNVVETQEVDNFVLGGGNFLAQCHGIDAYENYEFFQTTTGILIDNRSTNNGYYNHGDPFVQIEGILAPNPGGSISSFKAKTNGKFLGNAYTVVDKPTNGVKVATVRKRTPMGNDGGFTYYLGGHNYNQNLTNIGYNNGMRMYLNAMLVPATRPTACNFDFSSDLTLDKSLVGATPTNLGDTVTFLVSVCANGPGTAFDVAVLDSLHPNLTYVTYSTTSGTYSPLSGLWNIAMMSPGTCDSLWITCVVNGPFGTVNKAEIVSLHPGNAAIDDVDSVVIALGFPCTAIAGADTAFCGFNGTLGATLPLQGSGVWNVISGGATVQNNLLPNSSVTGLSVGSNLLEWVVTHLSCVNRDTVEIIAIAAPIANAGVDASTCDSATVLGATPPVSGTGLWTTLTAGATFANNGLGTTGVALADSGYFSLVWTVTDSICVDADTVTVLSSVGAYAGIDTTVCGGSGQLVAALPIQGTGGWNVLSGGGAIQNSSLNVSAVSGLSAGNNVFEWAVTYQGSDCRDTVTFTSLTVPLPDAGIDGITCDSTFTMAATLTGNGTGLWSSLTPGVTFANTASPTSGIAVTDTGYFYMVWTGTNGICAASDTMALFSSAAPIVFAGNDTTVCANMTSLQATLTTGVGSWSSLGSGPNITNPNSFTSTVTNLNVGPNLFTWNQVSGSCQGLDSVTITYLPADVAYAGTDQNFCGPAATMNALLPNGHTGSFWDTSSTVIFVNPNLPSTALTLPDSGSYSLFWIIDNGYCKDTASVMLHSDLPVIAFAGNDTSICNRALQLQGLATPLGTGTWSLPIGSPAQISSPNSNTTVVNQLVPGANNVFWTVINGTCTSIDTITISRPISAAVAGPDIDLCIGDTTTLAANDPSPDIGYWQVVSGAIQILDTNRFNSAVVGFPIGAAELVWSVTDSGCVTMDTLQVQVYPNPIADAGVDQTFDLANLATLDAVDIGPPMIGTWTTTSQAVIVNPNDANSLVTNIGLGTQLFVWSVSSGPCPVARDTARITINELVIPTAISPNQDGRNETFTIYGLSNLGTARLEIFNRWGGKVYETDSYQNDWGGKNNAGMQLPDDTYYYVLHTSSGFEHASYIIVKR
jgi:gliding motility-associated-like protein/uncharacterized repeat protein (TIGR01451 family)